MSGALIFGIALIDIIIVFIILYFLLLGLSAYILRSLFRLNKKGWIITYAIVIGVPFIICLIADKSGFAAAALWFVPLLFFYIYCWILRYSITEWLSDLGDEKAFELDKTYGNTFKKFMDFTE